MGLYRIITYDSYFLECEFMFDDPGNELTWIRKSIQIDALIKSSVFP